MKYAIRVWMFVLIGGLMSGAMTDAICEPCWKFLVYGDTRANHQAHREILIAMQRHSSDYDFIVNGGDITDDGRDAAYWEIWKEICESELGGLGQNQNPPKYMAAPGNHEHCHTEEGLKNWKTYLPGQTKYGHDGKYFMVDHKNVRLIFLYSKRDSIQNAAQLAFLQKAIHSNKKPWLFAVWHHPVLKFSHHNYRDDIHETWARMLYENGCDIIFMGHDHFYLRTQKLNFNGETAPPVDEENGTVHLVAGNGGAPLYIPKPYDGGKYYLVESSLSDFGYSEMAVTDDTLYYRHILRDGTVFDETKYTPNLKPGNIRPVIQKITFSETRQITLSWNELFHASAYHLYRSVDDAAFKAHAGSVHGIHRFIADQKPEEPGIQWTDPEPCPADKPVYYAVSAQFQGESGKSKPWAVFPCSLQTTATTNFNQIALPVTWADVSRADELMKRIPECSSVAFWHPEIQGYEQYVPGIEPANFNVHPGSVYYVNINSSRRFLMAGQTASPVFDLITTETTSFNEVMLPLEKSDIDHASALLEDIPFCNGVARWNAAFQGYEQYVPGITATDFEVNPGAPYVVHVTRDSRWPRSGIPKRRPVSSLIQAERLHAPHLIYGTLDLPEDIDASASIHIRAVMLSQPNTVLTQHSPGSYLKGRDWGIQCAAFPQGWKSGDVVFLSFDLGGRAADAFDVTLTYAPCDRARPAEVEGKGMHRAMLAQNQPNPFNPSTTLHYFLSNDDDVTLVIFNALGQQVMQLVNDHQKSGPHNVRWDGLDASGFAVPSGVYLCRLKTSQGETVRKMLLLR